MKGNEFMGKKKGKENDIILSCVGGSRDGITGSSWLISYPISNSERKLIALECGMIQGNAKPEYEYSDNKKMLENIPVEDVSAVFIMHSHVRWIILAIYQYLMRTMDSMERLFVAKKHCQLLKI